MPGVRALSTVLALGAVAALAIGVSLAARGDAPDRRGAAPPGSAAAPRRGAALDELVTALAADDQRGWTIASRLIAEPVGGARLVVTMRGGDGEALTGAAVEAEIRDPARDVGVAFALVEVADGRYQVALPLDGGDRYTVAVRARHGADHYASASDVALEAAP